MRGSIQSRGKDTHRLVVFLGRDEDGKQIRHTETVHGKKTDAQRRLRQVLQELDQGAFVDPHRMTTAEYLEKWLEHVKTQVSPKTAERYEDIVRKRLKPAFGHHALSRLHPLMIQSYYAKELESGRVNGKGGLSAQTVLHFHRVFNAALQQAVRWRLLSINPCDGVEAPRAQKKEMRALDEAETAELLDLLKDSSLYVPVLVAVTTGLRRGELLALRWQDIDLDAGTLLVCRTLQQTGKGLHFKTPKTDKSKRSLRLPPMTVEALRGHRIRQIEQHLAMGIGLKDDDLVFATPEGGAWKPNSFSSLFAATVARHSIRIRFHDLRHTHASQLLRQGQPVKVVSSRLGHSTAAFTLDVYSHLLPGMEEQAVDGVENALRLAMQKRAENA